MEEVVIKLSGLMIRSEEKKILDAISLEVKRGEAWAITGSSGSGKTTLGKVLAGFYTVAPGELNFNLPSDYKRIFVSQQHDFRYLSSARSYYQQRFDSNYGNDFPLVKEALRRKMPNGEPGFETRFEEVSKQLGIASLMGSRLIELSNGEGKRVQLAQALLRDPQLLILDNPFIGLDVESRSILHGLIDMLISAGTLIFLITTEDEIPEKITNVLTLEKGIVKSISNRQGFIDDKKEKKQITNSFTLDKALLQKLTAYPEENPFAVAVEMKDVTIAYDEKVILDRVSWKVMKGERWALKGHNGSGKSTLLSLILADNPKAYSNEIYLFDRRRGSGESIWDIKKKIGQISPELHIYFQRNTNYTEALSLAAGGTIDNSFSSSSVSCFEVVCSGYQDQVGSSNQLASLQYTQAEEWMKLLQIAHLKKQPLDRLSLGEQRLVLLARALVKNPPMLILDEPCQGLDAAQTRHFVNVVNEICLHSDKTLIYVSHYAEDIPSCVTKILTLEKGKASLY